MYWGGNSGETHLHGTDLKVDKSWNVLTAHTGFSQQSMQVGQGVLSEVLIRSLIFCPLKCVVCIGGFCCCFFFLLTSLGVDLNQTNSYFSNVVAVFLEEHWIPASLVLSIPSQVCVCVLHRCGFSCGLFLLCSLIASKYCFNPSIICMWGLCFKFLWLISGFNSCWMLFTSCLWMVKPQCLFFIYCFRNLMRS